LLSAFHDADAADHLAIVTYSASDADRGDKGIAAVIEHV
jgi:hypothetical protein